MWTRKLMWIAWPSFLVAGMLEMVVFAMVDPSTLYWLDQPLRISAEGVYTLSFFLFWGLVSLSGVMTVVLSLEPWEVDELAHSTERLPLSPPSNRSH